eukprot:CAMPEP_0202961996 /NCGR_PEP_ID=MMETSP1396-20130829/6091_1 /ASSEMBLY_ACC=CAM_ASM_000872 /TAXON_ID= /ORGANISM="Pseudokeronopsis sp., Strain Brazil" /LENGTH=102 /DNA_ID=CAMNT_0049682263 /DNA_START=1207 /DNA_END=1515 /DNA_ORIENTATION=+
MEQKIITEVFESIDIDQNKKIFWNEFFAASLSAKFYLTEENMKFAFNFFDREKKGYFELEDLRAVTKETSLSLEENDLENILQLFLKKGERVTFAEFKKMMH